MMSLLDTFLTLLSTHPDQMLKSLEVKPVGELYCLWHDTAGPCHDGTYVKIPLVRSWTPGSLSCARLEKHDVERICKEAEAIIAKGGGATLREVITSLGLSDAFKTPIDWDKH